MVPVPVESPRPALSVPGASLSTSETVSSDSSRLSVLVDTDTVWVRTEPAALNVTDGQPVTGNVWVRHGCGDAGTDV